MDGVNVLGAKIHALCVVKYSLPRCCSDYDLNPLTPELDAYLKAFSSPTWLAGELM